MSRLEHHSAFGFLFYYIIYIIWTGSFIMNVYLTIMIVFFSIFPDLDTIYFYAKARKKFKLDESFQHHYHSVFHYPITFTPVIIIFIISLMLNFYPLYFLTPVIGIYCGHFVIDTISCGDGVMWGKKPWKKGRFARFINVACKKTDGFHGYYWGARYRETLICKIGNVAVIMSAIIIQIFKILVEIYALRTGIDYMYRAVVIYFILLLYMGAKKYPREWSEKPPKGRYQDYRIDPHYINGLNEKNKRKHLEKYSSLLKN